MIKYNIKCMKCNAEYSKEFPEGHTISTDDQNNVVCPNDHKGLSKFPHF